MFFNILKSRKKEQEGLESRVLDSQARILALQSQINPHFLYNTLESIRSKALAHGEDEIAEMIESLALLFRYNIGREGRIVTLEDEIENIKNYMRIQNHRFRDKFSLRLDFDEIDDCISTYKIPPLTFQPLVENAIHHGLERKVGPGEILIRAFKSQKALMIEIKDDGLGIEPETVDKIRRRILGFSNDTDETRGNGIALTNVNRRLGMIYGAQYGLDLLSALGVGTTIELTLPLPENNRAGEDA